MFDYAQVKEESYYAQNYAGIMCQGLVLGGGCAIFTCMLTITCTLTSGSSDCDTFSYTHGTRVNAPTILHR